MSTEIYICSCCYAEGLYQCDCITREGRKYLNSADYLKEVQERFDRNYPKENKEEITYERIYR